MDPSLKEAVGEVDILFIPIGGGELLDPQKAASAAIHLGAKIVIPMNYNESQLKQFIKEFGADKTEPAEKLTIKKKIWPRKRRSRCFKIGSLKKLGMFISPSLTKREMITK